ncbi:MAG: aminotransferase class IV, partial [Gammaproteobacteria bacterium]|nr:aminotransferase class IV [Gammaproteobacteria bacterium]
MKRWLVNGEPDTNLTPFDRGLTYGDGLFETIAVRAGECRFFGAHYARLVVSCRRLSLPVPAQDGLLEGATQLIGNDADGTLKIIVTRGAGARGYRLPDDPQPTCIIGFSPEAPPAVPDSGIRARICRTPVSANPVLAG